MKRFLSLLLALMLVLSMLPVSAFAQEYLIEDTSVAEETVPAETTPEESVLEEIIPEELVPEETIPEETTAEATALKKNDTSVTEVASGTCGDNLNWTLDSDGVLSISGTGDMVNNFSLNSYSASVNTVIIGDGVTSIGAHAFTSCSNLSKVVIGNSVTSIGNFALQDCSNLVSVVIPDSVTSVGSYAFNNCNIEELIIADGSKTVTSAMTIDAKKVVISNTVTSIGDSAFYNRSGLKTIEIPDSVNSIGDYAFYGCSYLTNIELPNGLTSIGNDVFYGCKRLVNVTMSESVASIGEYAFADCSSLTEINIPDSVKSIGKNAFSGCSSLSSMTIGSGISEIDNAFYGCSSLEEINIKSLSAWLNTTFIEGGNSYPLYANSLEKKLYLNGELLTNAVIADDVSSIPKYAFYNCAYLESVKIPYTVTKIDSYAFRGCSNLTALEIADGVSEIGDNAFQGCSSLTTVEIPDSVSAIGDDVFSGCGSLESMTIPFVGESRKGATDTGKYPFGYLFGDESYEGGLKIAQYYDSNIITSTFYIPSSLKSVTVTGGDLVCGAFHNCSNLTEVIIGNNVGTIDESAFMNCSGLTSIEIPDSVTTIGANAFRECSNLTSIEIPDSVTTIGAYAFRDCSNLTEVVIGNNVTSIGTMAFAYCDDLVSVSIGSGVTKLIWDTFQYCSSLSDIYYSGTVEQWSGLSYQTDDYVHYSCTFTADHWKPQNLNATCLEDGYSCEACDCGYERNIVITQTALGHSFGAWTKVTAPTCTKKGSERRDCVNCDYFESREIAANGHNYTAVVTAPTCTERGYTTYTCACGAGYNGSYVDALGHSYGEWTEVIAPTCTQKGSERRDCVNCNHFETREISATGHTYTDVITPPTCTEQGYTTHTCTCGDEFADTFVEAFGHTWDEGVVTTEPTEETTGLRIYTCAACGTTREEIIPVLEHVHVYTGVVTPPTCTEQGYTTYTCACGDELIGAYVDALGHSYEEVEVQATCIQEGYISIVCHCGHERGRTIYGYGDHAYSNEVIAPTYTKQGYTEHTCSTCGDTYVDDHINALGLPTPVLQAENDEVSGKPVLTWEAIAEADYYEVYRSTSKTKNYKCIDTTEDVCYLDESASPGKTYYYKVKAICAVDESLNSDLSGYISEKSLYSQPVVEITNTTSGYPLLKWEKISGAKKYEIYYSTTIDGTYKKLTTTSSTSYTYSKAKMDTEYYFKVRAYGSSSSYAGAFSEIHCGVKKLAQPSITVTANHEEGSVKITWKKISGATKYWLHCSVNGGDYDVVDIIEGTSYIHEGLVVGNTYTYTLMADNGNADAISNWSTEKAATIRCGKPVLSTANTETGKPQLSWNVVNGAVAYEIQIATSSKGKYTQLAVVTEPGYIHEEAVGGKTYYYKVRAIDANETSGDFCSYKSATCKCEAPVITDVTTNSKGYPMIKWDKVTGAKKYEVWYATEADGQYKKLTTTSSTSYTYSKAKMDTEYYFKVRAYGSSTSSAGAFSETVCGIRKLAQPSISLSTSQSGRKITVKWKSVSKAIGYKLQCSVNGGEFATIAEGNILKFVHTDLAPGNQYTYCLQAISDKEETCSIYSSEKSSTIKVGKPAPSIALAENGKPQLTWEAVEGAVAYQIYYATSKSGSYKRVETTEELSFIYEEAKSGKTCYFKVRAVDINGNTGDYSSYVKIKSK